ncbi:MAG: DedA family protein [Hydrogenothermus sp.]|nr:MAG: DedA family protein [Hydrogenothermus sp.]
METLEQFLKNYGYIAVFIGTFLEGEIFVLITGFFIKLGYLKIIPSFVFASLGVIVHELIYFFLGRWKGREFLLKNRYTRKKYRKAKQFLEKYGVLSIFIVRFLYGMRIVPIVLMGASGFNVYKFLFFNILSLFIWMSIYLSLGYVFGKLAEVYFGKAKEYYFIAVGILFAIITLIFLIFKIKEKLNST